ncbi:MAG: DUF2802 domain-containing protein [Rhodocyclales bacterium]|nr:DUF2802 domain-containing protein [Rhodocyclales bacterium]
MGWREMVMLAAALAGVYLVIALLALARMRRRPPRARNVEPTAPDNSGPAFKPQPPGQVWDHPFLTPVRLPDEPPPVPTGVPVREEVASPFAATLAATELEAELRQLRAEVEQLRQELAEVKQARRVSPLYADAAALAHRGFDARGVAEECGISVAEAELVLAMSKDEKNFDSEVGDGADGRKHDVAG